MKKFCLFLLMGALALPMMAQQATKAESMRPMDRDEMVQTTPLKAFDANQTPTFKGTKGGVTTWDFETEDQLSDWGSYDADGDGYGWEVDTYYSYGGGTTSLVSRSFYGGALSPDNWLISPQVALEGTLTIHAMNYSYSWLDVIKVYACVGEFNVDDPEGNLVELSEDLTPPAEWTEYTYDMSQFGGEMGCIIIRHYNCTDMFRIYVDAISIGLSMPESTTPENLAVEPGANNGYVTWADEDDSMWNLRYRVYTEPSSYFWDFENDTELPWTNVDSDGDGYGWFLWDPISAGYNPGDGERLFGTKCASSASYQGVALTPDNWMISPKVTLSGNLSFWAAGQDPDYAGEVFAVYVSTTGNEIDDFVKISEDITATSPIQEYTFDLSEYEGMEGYIAIRHYNVTDMFRLNIDNILIGTPAEEAEWIVVEGLTDPYYLIEGLDPETTYEVQVMACDVDEVESAWTESCIFTTTEEVGPDPEDPHMTGYWAVFTNPEGVEDWIQLIKGDNDEYVNTVTLSKGVYGTFNPEDESTRPLVPVYVVINGVRYGAEVDLTPAAYGQASANPLFENENFYTLPAGYQYSVGVSMFLDGTYGLYVARGAMTDVDELVAGKTIAGVRYFNAAGQEMSEANGLTIMVTTYTDGSTSVAKVIK